MVITQSLKDSSISGRIKTSNLYQIVCTSNHAYRVSYTLLMYVML